MAPITEENVQEVKDLVHKLEARVRELEQKLSPKPSAPKSPSDAMRMILMGPPGAGKKLQAQKPTIAKTIFRKRYSGSEYQGQILHLPFGTEAPNQSLW